MTAGAAPAPASDSASSLHDEPGWRGLVRTPAMVGVVVAVGLMFMAWLLPAAFNWNIHMRSWPPLHAVWEPRVRARHDRCAGARRAGVAYAARLAQSLSWRALLLVSYVTSFAWLTSLALVDGEDGIGVILDYKFEYMNTRPADRRAGLRSRRCCTSTSPGSMPTARTTGHRTSPDIHRVRSCSSSGSWRSGCRRGWPPDGP